MFTALFKMLEASQGEALFAYFTVGLIVLGLVSQLTRQHDGGKTARAAPCVTVILLIVIVVFGERIGVLANREGNGGSLPDLSSTSAGQRNVTGFAALQAELARLQAVLKQAVADEDYAKAAELKPKIKQLKATAREPGALRTPGSGGKRKGSRRNRKLAPGATSVAAADAATTTSDMNAVATASAAVAIATTVDTATMGVGAAGAAVAGSGAMGDMGDSESGKGRKRGGAPEGDESSGKKRGRRGRRSGTTRVSSTTSTTP